MSHCHQVAVSWLAPEGEINCVYSIQSVSWGSGRVVIRNIKWNLMDSGHQGSKFEGHSYWRKMWMECSAKKRVFSFMTQDHTTWLESAWTWVNCNHMAKNNGTLNDSTCVDKIRFLSQTTNDIRDFTKISNSLVLSRIQRNPTLEEGIFIAIWRLRVVIGFMVTSLHQSCKTGLMTSQNEKECHEFIHFKGWNFPYGQDSPVTRTKQNTTRKECFICLLSLLKWRSLRGR